MSQNLPSISDLLKQKTTSSTPAVITTPQKPSSEAPEPVASTIAPTPPTPTPPPATSTIVLADKEVSAKLSEKIQTIGLRERETEVERNAQTLKIPYINLKGFPISPDALTLIPEEQAKQLKAICFLFTGPELRVATTQPNDARVKELVFELGERHKTNAEIYLMSAESFSQGIKMYDALPKIKPIIKGVQITEEEIEKYQAQMTDFSSIAGVLEHANVTDVIAVVIAASLKLGSSDIHIEAEERGIAVRFRVDGILQDVAKLAPEQWKKIINRIKLIASLKMNINDQAQDGRFTIYQKNKEIDVRTSTIPTSFGESIVMRLLNPESIAVDFEQLGFRPASLKKLQKEIDKPNGMIITTGPTGSGKTTTLYAILRKLNTSDVKIITLEDPVEYKVQGINQSQIDYSKDYTFAKGLRSILRQDPDIVMVGEIRDLDTAEIAVQASLTGHLLLSTIHTNDAAGAIPRFLSMGLAPHLLAPALNAIMGQRLLRRLCSCKQPTVPPEELMADVKKQLESIPESSGEAKVDTSQLTFYGPKGCEKCNNTGYKGRIGAYEILIKTPELEKTIIEKGTVSEYDMRALAVQQGMVTMTQDGLLKAIDGMTSIEEVKRTLGI
ncbi:MAG: GspE/PulE family protein [Patescibacteria group bacterium]|jgi:type IV pilus assembly protein PilB